MGPLKDRSKKVGTKGGSAEREDKEEEEMRGGGTGGVGEKIKSS